MGRLFEDNEAKDYDIDNDDIHDDIGYKDATKNISVRGRKESGQRFG